jgi:tRNA-specific 2-thiouridylase
VYVLALHAADQRVVVGPKSSLERTTLTASEVNWMMREPAGDLRVTAQIRHRHPPAAATVRSIEPGCRTRAGQAELVFDAPQMAVTPGQAVVFYQDDVVVGGGCID